MKFCFEKKEFVDLEINPNKLAVIGDDFELTWAEFKTQVDALCSYLKQKGLENLDSPVILYGHKSANMMVVAYAMMQLKIPYIPIDLIYPEERVLKIIATAKAQVILNTTSTPLSIHDTTEILINRSDFAQHQSSEVNQRKSTPKDPLIYIIFTSGSTGEPKGVQISTEAIQSFTRWMTSDFNFSENEVFINSAVLSFDLSVFEVMTFGALGATLLLNNTNTTSDPAVLMPRIQHYQGSVWVSTPSHALMYSRIEQNEELNSIGAFLFCGEVLPHGTAKNLLKNYPNAKVFNTYGPTEATVATTLVEITEDVLNRFDPLPVGYSKPESDLIIENEEIIIIGPNVSMGYVNNAELNQRKFITINNQRAFKTGDKGRLENGMLFFSGRNDDLLKLHGYRIELNEITATINNLDYVLHGEAIPLKRKDIVKKIVCLVQINPSKAPIAPKTIKSDLAKTLPHYMIPADVKLVDKIPLNQNGKADKKLLTQLYMKK